MTGTIETAFDYLGEDEKAYFSTSEKKWIRHIFELQKKHPGDVEIKVLPEDNDGCLCATLPKGWMKITPPRKLDLTDDQREERRRMVAVARANRR